MQYIVLDLEWNQPWPGSYSAKKILPSPVRGEIIQIGAVRVTEEQQVSDEFQILVQPKYYKKLNRKISSLTGIKDAALRERGVPFPEAMARFRKWCGEDIAFLTWGFDDITILKENLLLHNLLTEWVDRWYNAQMIFNQQTDGASNQRGLTIALELMGISPSRPAHDALGDAYHTALICAKLDLRLGISEYEKSLERHENGFHGAELPGCVARRVYHGYKDKKTALSVMATRENICPTCGGKMKAGHWIPQPGRRYMNRVVCKKDGVFYIRVRLQLEDDGTLRAGRLTYAADSDPAKTYEKLAAKPRHRIRGGKRKQVQNEPGI